MNNSEKINQELYIKNKLKTFTGCKINKTIDDNYEISTPFIKNILENNFTSGSAMNALVCLFDNLFISTNKHKIDGLYHLSEEISQWMKITRKIDTKSEAGFVFFSHILSDIEVIIKMPRHQDYDDEIIREYFIGVSEINKLRYILPNFVYTFGLFICPTDNNICNKYKDGIEYPIGIFEKIPGKNMSEMLEGDELTFSEYLGMFVQILLALEVAQRNISFCHNDFHTANLMCRTINTECNYKVPLDDNVYEVTASKYLPVIIDFGSSSVKNNGRVIGSYDFPEYGMMEYMLPGVDMYKFLVHSYLNAQGKVKSQILNLMSFYKLDDPYKFLIDSKNAIKESISEYVKKGSFSNVAKYTPLEFLIWLLNDPNYSKIVSKYIKRIERNIDFPLYFSTTVKEYNNIFNHKKLGKEKTIDLVNKCIKKEASYIMSKYSLHILNGYNEKLKSDKLTLKIKNIEEQIDKLKEKMIEIDMKLLRRYESKYAHINFPDNPDSMLRVHRHSDFILNIPIDLNFLKNKKKQVLMLIEEYFEKTNIFKEILPYLQIIYTIRELNLNTIYNTFLNKFLESPQYKFYSDNYLLVNKTYRWCNILNDIIKSIDDEQDSYKHVLSDIRYMGGGPINFMSDLLIKQTIDFMTDFTCVFSNNDKIEYKDGTINDFKHVRQIIVYGNFTIREETKFYRTLRKISMKGNNAKITLIGDMTEKFDYVYRFNSDVSKWDVSMVSNMSGMFFQARSFTGKGINNWDVSRVTDMGYMFYEATSFNQPIDRWNTSNVTDMRNMFDSARNFNQSLNTWNTYKVANFFNIFYYTKLSNKNRQLFNFPQRIRIYSLNTTYNNMRKNSLKIMKHIFDEDSDYDIICLQEVNNYLLNKIIKKAEDHGFFHVIHGDNIKYSNHTPSINPKKEHFHDTVLIINIFKIEMSSFVTKKFKLKETDDRTIMMAKFKLENVQTEFVITTAHFSSDFSAKKKQLKQIGEILKKYCTNPETSVCFHIGDTNLIGDHGIENYNKTIEKAGLFDLLALVELWENPDRQKSNVIRGEHNWRHLDDNPHFRKLGHLHNDYHRPERILITPGSYDSINFHRTNVEIDKNNLSNHDGLIFNLDLITYKTNITYYSDSDSDWDPDFPGSSEWPRRLKVH